MQSSTVLYTAPRVLPDSAGLFGVQMGHKLSHGPSVGLRWTGPLSRNIQHTYLIYVAGLCRTGLDRTGLDWTVPDWSTFKKHITYISDICCWTVPDWTGLDWTGLDWTGLCRTGPLSRNIQHTFIYIYFYNLYLHIFTTYIYITTSTSTSSTSSSSSSPLSS